MNVPKYEPIECECECLWLSIALVSSILSGLTAVLLLLLVSPRSSSFLLRLFPPSTSLPSIPCSSCALLLVALLSSFLTPPLPLSSALFAVVGGVALLATGDRLRLDAVGVGVAKVAKHVIEDAVKRVTGGGADLFSH